MAQTLNMRLTTGLLIVSLSGCAVGPDFVRPQPPDAVTYGKASDVDHTVETAASRGGPAQRFDSGADIPAQWWALFQSDKLSKLVEQALQSNPNLDAAKAALRQAQELHAAQRAALYPSVVGGLGASRSLNPDASISNPTVSPASLYSLYTAQLGVSYSPDAFGGTRRAIESAQAQASASRYQFEAAYTALSANVVVTAIQEASLRGQIVATERLLELQHQVTGIVKHRRDIGSASNGDLLAQQALEAQTAATLPPLKKQLAQTRDALTALLGALPSDEPGATFQLNDLTLPRSLPVSIPSRLLEQRPDVRQAEENLHAATAQVGVAVSLQLPQFTLDGAIGFTSLSYSQLFGFGNHFWTLGAALSQTLFDAGALSHRKQAAVAAMDEAAAQYRAAVILACQNVADTLHALQADAEALHAASQAAEATGASFEMARRQYEIGVVSRVDLAMAEQAYRQAELALVVAEANRYTDTAGLFLALGGGWWNRTEDVAHD